MNSDELNHISSTFHKRIRYFSIKEGHLKVIEFNIFKPITKTLIKYSVTDGDQDKENLRRRAISTHNAGRCKKLFRTIRTGKFSNFLNSQHKVAVKLRTFHSLIIAAIILMNLSLLNFLQTFSAIFIVVKNNISQFYSLH